MLSEARKQYFEIMAETYKRYHYPAICGWIEALMLLEPKEWTQKSLSDSLSELFPEPDSSTSVSSINRAVKVLEEYGTIKKSGSRKIGYHYTINEGAQAVINMFLYMVQINDDLARKLGKLKDTTEIKSDQKLQELVAVQQTETIRYSTYFRRFLSLMDSWLRRDKVSERSIK